MLVEILFALVTAFLFTWIFAVGFRRHRRFDGLFLFFLVLFFITWAGGIWLVPWGPLLLGVYFLPFLVIGFFVSLLLTVILPPQPPKKQTMKDEIRKCEDVGTTFIILDAFFWLLIICLIAAIIIKHL